MDDKTWDEQLAELTRRFVMGLDTRLEEVERQITLRDWERVASLAHKLKGAAASYGFKELADGAKELETMARLGHEHLTQPFIEKIVCAISRSKIMAGLST